MRAGGTRKQNRRTVLFSSKFSCRELTALTPRGDPSPRQHETPAMPTRRADVAKSVVLNTPHGLWARRLFKSWFVCGGMRAATSSVSKLHAEGRCGNQCFPAEGGLCCFSFTRECFLVEKSLCKRYCQVQCGQIAQYARRAAFVLATGILKGIPVAMWHSESRCVN